MTPSTPTSLSCQSTDRSRRELDDAELHERLHGIRVDTTQSEDDDAHLYRFDCEKTTKDPVERGTVEADLLNIGGLGLVGKRS